jgi:hypothetical protein
VRRGVVAQIEIKQNLNFFIFLYRYALIDIKLFLKNKK